MAVPDSAESWERLRDTVLLPGLTKVENGLPDPPEETTFEIYKVQTA